MFSIRCFQVCSFDNIAAKMQISLLCFVLWRGGGLCVVRIHVGKAMQQTGLHNAFAHFNSAVADSSYSAGVQGKSKCG